ncbi:MAG TPA: carboxypeptidase-like regulatory domain-containing protein [Chitinophaga sp.]|uniref:carboxypeptidase-like regulatory domain-containing protein n=1 Tax=Chitinophaga sp. TaxID=1869181 RepID=UPI002C2B81FA|nr:carboxypeptidase-like regulatory domain-containing protein [Chitinophaga sp.]HVI45921.1 carboxypeptidase-like regulatory domain-containing protein [Chitinophaga sp.]
MYKKTLWLFALVVSLMACDKSMVTVDNPPVMNPGTSVPTPPISGKQVETSVQGVILDENNEPLPGVMVTSGNTRITTDTHGAFLLPKITVSDNAAVVTAQKPGYFNGIRTFMVSGGNKLQYLQIKLLRQQAAGTFDATAGGNISASNAQFSFQPQHVRTLSNVAYTGKVTLLYAPINPEDESFRDIMPGDLRGINSSRTITGLESYGMMALELRGENGEKLQLDSTKSLLFKMNIPTSLRGAAPANIPLWYFDEVSGLWKEEGSASKIGDSYVGSVKHFSFWNCDAQIPIITFKALIQNEQGSALANTCVIISRSNGSEMGGYTNADGEVKGSIPANETLTLKILDHCGKALFTKQIGPYRDSVDLGIQKVLNDLSSMLVITGNVSTCDGMPVKNGYVNIALNSIRFSARVQNGSYRISFLYCGGPADITINAVDEDARKSSLVTMQVKPGSYIQHLQACDVMEASTGNFVLEGKTFAFNSINDTLRLQSYLNSDSLYTAEFKQPLPKQDRFSWQFDNIQSATTSIRNFTASAGGTNYSAQLLNCTITANGGIGKYLEGTISGNVLNKTTNQQVPITGSFKLRQ